MRATDHGIFPSLRYFSAILQHLFFILAAWKSDFYRVVKSASRKHLASCQPLLDILATQKNSREPRIKILCFRCVNLQHFEGLKLRILKFPETFGSRLCDYRWAFFGHFNALKMPFCLVVGPWAQVYIAYS